MPGRNGRSRSCGVRWSRMRTSRAAVMGAPWVLGGGPGLGNRDRPGVVTSHPWTSCGSGAVRKSEAMGHSSVAASPGSSSSLRTVRSDGTPVYRYQQRPGLPPVSVIHFDTQADHLGLPPDDRHAHDFLVLVYVEEGGGSFAVDGAERPLRAGEVHAVPPGQVIDVAAVSALARCRAWSVAFTPDAVPALASVSPLSWTHHPLLALFAPGAGHGAVAEPDRASWSGWLAKLAEELAEFCEP